MFGAVHRSLSLTYSTNSQKMKHLLRFIIYCFNCWVLLSMIHLKGGVAVD